jgi:hypothetical protein
MLKLFIPFVVFFFLTDTSFAQAILEGYVIDAESGAPVAFANITVKNKIAGTAANEDGYFKMMRAAYTNQDTLLITHIEYLSAAVPLSDFLSGVQRLRLKKNTIMLQTIDVVASEDDQTLEEIVAATRASLKFPMTQKLYYREIVKENKSYNKFADGLLTVVYPEDKDDMLIKVDQCRAKDLPKDNDDIMEAMNGLKLDVVLGYQYTNFLDRFRGDNKKNYHFYRLKAEGDEGTILKIEPKKDADRSDDKLLFYATIKADNNMKLQETVIHLDSLCNFEKSILGIHVRLARRDIILNFSTFDGQVYLSHIRYNAVIGVTGGKLHQSVNCISELVTGAVKLTADVVERKDRFKKSALYKFGNKYDHDFWKTVNMPVMTPEEEQLLKDLEGK